MKGIQTGKEVKLSLFSNDMIPHIEDAKDASNTRKLLEFINEFSKATRYKINTEISCISIY